MPRPILLGIVGDSAAGKTTLTRGLVRILGPVYRHRDGTLGPGEYVTPMQFTIVEGMLGFHTAAMRHVYDVRIFLDPPEDLRRRWKVQRDCSRRGYTTDDVLAELDRREADAETFIRPQRNHADIVISFMPGDRGDPEHLDARLAMRPGLAHPDLLPTVRSDGDGLRVAQHGAETVLWVPGTIDPERSATFEEAIWDRLHFATHLRTERLGEFTVGTELHRSEPLAITQLLVLYQLATARAAVALGASGARVDHADGATALPAA
jgi:phosphoribulokinase